MQGKNASERTLKQTRPASRVAAPPVANNNTPYIPGFNIVQGEKSGPPPTSCALGTNAFV